MNMLYDRGLITEGTIFEFLASHTAVVFQPEFDDPRYSGINPYALGFAMMTDIKRICEEPTTEDRDWFPAFAGKGDWRAVLKDAWANYRDESFIEQFLAQGDARFPPLRAARPRRRPCRQSVGDPQRAGLPAASGARWRAPMTCPSPTPTSRSSAPRCAATARSPWRIAAMTASRCMSRRKTSVLAHIERLWGHSVVLEDIKN